jgi:cobalt-zinc-cadmium resistance protein CzcA
MGHNRDLIRYLSIGEVYRYIIGNNHSVTYGFCRNLLLFPDQTGFGIADVTNFGGITTQFQIELDPHKLEQWTFLSEVTETISKNNVSAGSMLPRGELM